MQSTSYLKGWLEIGMSNPNIFQYQSNSDILFRTYDESNSNKIIVGNTSSNNTPNCLGAMYISNNSVGVRKMPGSNIVVDVNGNMAISSNLYIGTLSTLSTSTFVGDIVIANSNTSNMYIANTSNSFKMTYGDVERLKITNGNGLYFNDNVYIANDVYATSFHMTSDKHLKNNIRQSKQFEDLQTLLRLNVCDFEYKCDPYKQKRKGFIAQEVEEVFPQAIQHFEGIVPFYCKSVILRQSESGKWHIPIEKCVYPEFDKEDKIVIGKTQYSKDFILPIRYVDDQNNIELDDDIPHDLMNNTVFIHGILRKIKAIDPNQMLALCISSIQELITFIA